MFLVIIIHIFYVLLTKIEKKITNRHSNSFLFKGEIKYALFTKKSIYIKKRNYN